MATKAQHNRRYQSIPRLLRAIREEAGFTQRELAKALGRPQSWIYNCETANRRVDLAEFCEWCEACSLDPALALRRYMRERP